ARFFLNRFCAGYDSASQAGGGTEEPIYSQALLLEPRHGLPPPPPQIALRFAAQIILEERAKIQDTSHGGYNRKRSLRTRVACKSVTAISDFGLFRGRPLGII